MMVMLPSTPLWRLRWLHSFSNLLRSLGGRLKLHPKEVGIFGVVHEVNAEIGEIRGMSAHGDYNDLSQWLACQDPKHVKKLFLVHGDYEVQLEFKNRLIGKDFLMLKFRQGIGKLDWNEGKFRGNVFTINMHVLN